MIFTPEEVRQIRQGKQTATLLRASARINVDETVPLRRRTEEGVEIVTDPTATSDRVLVVLTIRDAVDLELAALTADHAKACGFRTATGAREAFRQKHPRARLVKFVTFELGDNRDRARWLRVGAPGPVICPRCKRGLHDHQGICKCGHRRPYARAEDRGYTTRVSRAMVDAGEALGDAHLERYAAMNGQKFIAHNARMEAEIAKRGIVRRLRAVEEASPVVNVRKELRIIEQRIERAEKRKVRDRGD